MRLEEEVTARQVLEKRVDEISELLGQQVKLNAVNQQKIAVLELSSSSTYQTSRSADSWSSGAPYVVELDSETSSCSQL